MFTGTKRMADQLTRSLRQEGWPALAIHGDKSQNERDWVLEQFKTGKQPLMIATDVAARGLDVKVGQGFEFRQPLVVIMAFVSGEWPVAGSAYRRTLNVSDSARSKRCLGFSFTRVRPVSVFSDRLARADLSYWAFINF